MTILSSTQNIGFVVAYLGGSVDWSTSANEFIDDVDVTFLGRQVKSSQAVLETQHDNIHVNTRYMYLDDPIASPPRLLADKGTIRGRALY